LDVLQSLRVRNLGIIRAVELELNGGFVVITGETGAGKTLVTTAIDLLLGGRGRSDQVSVGADRAVISGSFADDDSDLVVTRELTSAGRSKYLLNGELASSSQLRDLLGTTIEVFGQHLSVSLTRPSVQSEILDRFGEVDTSELHALRARLRALEAELGEHERFMAEGAREREFLRFELDEIRKRLPFEADEDDRLIAELEALEQVEAISEAARSVFEVLGGDQGGGMKELVGRAEIELEHFGPTRSLAQRLRGLGGEIDDLRSELRLVLEGLESDPGRVEVIHGRLADLQGLMRRFGLSLSELKERERELSNRLGDRGDGSERRETLRSLVEECRSCLIVEEKRVRTARVEAARGLEESVLERFRVLSLERASLLVQVGEEGDGAPITFLFSANPGQRSLPLRDVASGGELSRVMLALSLVVGGEAATMIFDEVDAGIGGETAFKVGEALRSLARSRQVIVVTHLAQVAAFADQHIVVVKSQSDDETVTEVVALEDEEARISEIARMLSGQSLSVSAREHAAELITLAQTARL
jgi:DNA repair protein RecN (Recombination protein N)